MDPDYLGVWIRIPNPDPVVSNEAKKMLNSDLRNKLIFGNQFGDFNDLDSDPYSSNFVVPDPDPHHCHKKPGKSKYFNFNSNLV